MKKLILITFLFGLFVPSYIYAGTVSVTSPKSSIVGDEVILEVRMDPGMDDINALSGEIHIDPSLASLERVYDGNSPVLFWVEEPKVDTAYRHGVSAKNTIIFSGFSPGGIQGKGAVFSFVIKLKAVGNLSFIVQKASLLKNDGQGTPARVSTPESTLQILPGDSNKKIVIEDLVSPEVFTLLIGTSTEIYNGAYFVSFATQDKGVGIDHYEFASTWLLNPGNKDWKEAMSPQILAGKDLYKKIFIKAVDKAGNTEISTVNAPKHYSVEAVGAIIGIILLCVLYFIARLFL